MISIIIPSFNDPDLEKTIADLKQKAEGAIEIVAIKDKPMRTAINEGVAQSKGEWIMKCDAHCVFGQGYDRILLEDIENNWIVIPRRYKFDTKKWEVMDEPPIDYMKLFVSSEKIGGVEWKRPEREDILIDETMVFQGSCWLMSRKHWDWLGGLQLEGYGTFTQEPIELALKTWLGGGKVMVNKKTWYAHKHRKFGRTTAGLTSSQEVKDGNAYSKDFWVNNRWDKRIHDLDWLPKRFGTRL